MPLYNKDKQGIGLTPSAESGVQYGNNQPFRSSYDSNGAKLIKWLYKPLYTTIGSGGSVDLFTLTQGYFTSGDDEFHMLYLLVTAISPSTRSITSAVSMVEYKYFTNRTSLNNAAGTGETVDAATLLTIENNQGITAINAATGQQGIVYNINGLTGTTTFTLYGQSNAFVRGIYSYI